MTNSENNVQLGKQSRYPDRYDPSLLMPIPRELNRANLGLQTLPFDGEDIWTAYEVSWLDSRGKPRVAMAEFRFDCRSEHIIESKSFKYYLNSHNQTRHPSRDALQTVLARDLSAVAGGAVSVTLMDVDAAIDVRPPQGTCVDDLDVEIQHYSPSPSLLATGRDTVSDAVLYSHLLKSNCPVTGQPDWATLWVRYSGQVIEPSTFLQYVVSFRQHQDFHENCVEKIFCDIRDRCQTDALTVYARYTRRGGLDINPFRTDCDAPVPAMRIARQ